jgi:hypothetical protein
VAAAAPVQRPQSHSTLITHDSLLMTNDSLLMTNDSLPVQRPQSHSKPQGTRVSLPPSAKERR